MLMGMYIIPVSDAVDGVSVTFCRKRRPEDQTGSLSVPAVLGVDGWRKETGAGCRIESAALATRREPIKTA